MSISPYLFFSGDCAQAFDLYQRVFGGEAQVMTHGDLPPGESMPGAEPHHVMHASLPVGDSLLMGSDDPSGDGGAKVGFSISYTAADPEAAQRVFDALSEGGEVTMPIEATFWSRAFGMCTDAFGVPWMIDTAAAEGEDQ